MKSNIRSRKIALTTPLHIYRTQTTPRRHNLSRHFQVPRAIVIFGEVIDDLPGIFIFDHDHYAATHTRPHKPCTNNARRRQRDINQYIKFGALREKARELAGL